MSGTLALPLAPALRGGGGGWPNLDRLNLDFLLGGVRDRENVRDLDDPDAERRRFRGLLRLRDRDLLLEEDLRRERLRLSDRLRFLRTGGTPAASGFFM